MCGITGYLDRRGLHSDSTGTILTGMTKRLRPRGPDGDGFWTDGRLVAFGHTRLAILDLDGGGQPMTLPPRSDNPDALVLTYNGEIYNYVELRRELAGRGHQFTGTGDTEVLLHAYAEWGPDAVNRLNGMFAFALGDGARRQLVLARDHLGVKPLYYYELTDEQGVPCGVVFGSEIKALLAHPDVPAHIDSQGINELVTMLPMRTPGLTPYVGVRELRPGHLMIVPATGTSRLREDRYWSLPAREHTDDVPTTVARVRELLEDTLTGQVRADQPVTLMLSGGIDSSAVAALARQRLTDPVHSFCVDYPPGDGVAYAASAFHVDSDAGWARTVADHIGTDHHAVVVTLDDLYAHAERTLEAMDLPSIGHVNIPLTVLMAAVAEYAPVTIGGEGADEGFGGYAMHNYGGGGFPWGSTYPTPYGLLTADARAQLQPEAYLAEKYQLAREQVPVLPGEELDVRARREVTHMIATHYLPFLLRRVDRLSMASGLEARVPFCDHRLAEYVFNVPPHILTGGGTIPKWLLRQATTDLLPPEVVWRPKSGFPVAQTQRWQKDVWARLRDLAGTRGPVTDLIDWPAVRRMLDRAEGDVASDWTSLLHAAFLLEVCAWQERTAITLI
jgi:asparagine synthase (glutamine-hydrolysing)